MRKHWPILLLVMVLIAGTFIGVTQSSTYTVIGKTVTVHPTTAIVTYPTNFWDANSASIVTAILPDIQDAISNAVSDATAMLLGSNSVGVVSVGSLETVWEAYNRLNSAVAQVSNRFVVTERLVSNGASDWDTARSWNFHTVVNGSTSFVYHVIGDETNKMGEFYH